MELSVESYTMGSNNSAEISVTKGVQSGVYWKTSNSDIVKLSGDGSISPSVYSYSPITITGVGLGKLDPSSF